LLPELKGVPNEFGRERLEPERLELLESARMQQKKKELKAAPAAVQEFVQAAIDNYLERPFRLWSRRGRRATTLASYRDEPGENAYLHAHLLAANGQRAIVEAVWQLVQARQRLDWEYRLHQMGRLWLLVHGPAAWVLLVLIIEHVVVSVRYGGF
jgi:hypothetical protein